MSRFRPVAFGLALLAVAGRPLHAQSTPPQGVLAVPKPGSSKPAPPPTPPKAAPVTPVQRVAPVAEGSALGHSTPGKAAPVVTSGKPAHAEKPAAAKPHTQAAAPKAPAPVKAAAPAATVAVATGAAAAVANASVKADAAIDTTPPPPERPPVDPAKGSATGQPIPRWAALRTDEVNLRKGPGPRYPIEWVYRRRDLPVLIEREFEVWRLITDQDGVKGWVHSATLTGRRSFVVKGNDATLRGRARDDADAVAVLKPGVVGRIEACPATAAWCEVSAGGFKGWLPRTAMFGISPGEAVGS